MLNWILHKWCRFWHQYIHAYGFHRDGDEWICSECYRVLSKIKFKIEKGAIK